MSELYGKFVFGFCKVGFVCWNGDPNWLGWISIGIGGLLIGGPILYVSVMFIWAVLDYRS